MEYIFTPKELKLKRLFSSERHINVTAPLHINCEMEIVIVTKGTVRMQIAGEGYEISEGHASFVMPFEPHSFATQDYNECHVLMFASSIIKQFFEFLISNKPVTRCFEVSDEALRLTDKILPYVKNTADYVDALACIAPICREIKNNCGFTKDKSKYDDIFLMALTIANKEFSSQITLEDVAKRIGINHATLSRKFSDNAKVSFNTYISFLRCSYAASLIVETASTFTEIAYQSGFGSIRNFNRAFLRHMGCTPSEFRRNPYEIDSKIQI